MKVVYKYELPQKNNSIIMNEGAEVLKVMWQRHLPCLWAIVDTERPLVTRKFTIYQTGEQIVEPEYAMWIATFGVFENDLIYHCFETFEP